MSDPAAWLTAALARAEKTARAASGGEGWWVINPRYADHRTITEYVIEGEHGKVVHIDVEEHAPESHRAEALLIQANNPAAVLRRVAADRALLADLQAERHLVVDGDCWFTCPAATEERDGGENCDDDRRGGPCDCGRDARVERRVRMLAEGWGWPGV